MRIRKGHRCLPMPPADRSSMHGVLDDTKVVANQALLSLVALATASVADNSIGDSECVQEYTRDLSTERKKCLELELERIRVSGDGALDNRSSFCNAESSKTLPGAKACTRRNPIDTTGTISSCTSALQLQHQLDLLEQSLCHICSRAGVIGVSVRDAVSQIAKQGLPGLYGVGVELFEEVAKSFRHSSKFVECKERGTYCLRDLLAGKEERSLMTGDSEFHHERTISSSDMLGAAKQLQYLQKSRSNSLGSGVVEPSATPSVHGGKQKAVRNKRFIRLSTVATVVKSNSSSSSAYRSHNVTQVDPCVTRCARDDGKRWKCTRPAQSGLAMCTYHRDLINQGKERRTRARMEARPNPTLRYVANARVMKDATMTKTSWSPFSDDELSYDEHRQFVKAKSITSLLLNTDVRPRQ